MKRMILALALLLPFALRAQTTDSTTSLDVLRSPASPAFNLLGISPSSIERPTDLNTFRLSVQNASNNFSKLPSDYSVEIAPATLFNAGNQTLSRFNAKRFRDYFLQTLSISFGLAHVNREDVETDDSGSFTRIGIGLKFSLYRPQWSVATEGALSALKGRQRALLDKAEELEKSNEALRYLKYTRTAEIENSSMTDAEKQLARDSVQARVIEIKDSIYTIVHTDITFTRLNEAARNFKIERPGPFLDFAAGVVLDFPDNRFNYSVTSKAGAWLTGGYESGNKGLSALGIVRYLYQPDKIFADDSNRLMTDNISTLDAGGRLILTGLGGKFSVSAEAVYRSVLNHSVIAPDWRFTFNTDYDIGFNKKITLAIGKNFDGTITKTGNLIAALNLIVGFGASKKILADN